MLLRASSLPGFNDCARRTAARLWPREVMGAGFELRQTLPSIGSAVGTTTHAIVSAIATAKRADPAMDYDAMAALLPGATATALEAMHEEVAGGIEWDDSTPNMMVAQMQVERMARAFLPTIREETPLLIEQSFEASVGSGWKLTGTLDCLTEWGRLIDWKTGAVSRSYHAQLGAYVMLAKAHGHQVQSAGTGYTERTRQRAPQKPMAWRGYDVAGIEREAWATVERVKASVGAFLETREPEKLPANPMSMMCQKKFCPAWGTAFCSLGAVPDAADNPSTTGATP